MAKILSFSISNITCDSCGNIIRHALKPLTTEDNAVLKSFDMDTDEKKLTIFLDDDLSDEKTAAIVQKVKDELSIFGYECSESNFWWKIAKGLFGIVMGIGMTVTMILLPGLGLAAHVVYIIVYTCF